MHQATPPTTTPTKPPATQYTTNVHIRIARCKNCGGGMVYRTGVQYIDDCVRECLRTTPWHISVLAALSYLASVAVFIGGVTLAFADTGGGGGHHHHSSSVNNDAEWWFALLGVSMFFSSLWLVDSGAQWYGMDVFMRNTMWVGAVTNMAASAAGGLGFVALAIWRLSVRQVMTATCTTQLMNGVCCFMVCYRLVMQYRRVRACKLVLATVPGWWQASQLMLGA